jgi:hypothetical protein
MAIWIGSPSGPEEMPPDVEDVAAVLGRLDRVTRLRDERGGIQRQDVVDYVTGRVLEVGLLPTAGVHADAVHDRLGVAVRCEAGRANTNNDGVIAVLEASVDPLVRRLILVVPHQYKGTSTVDPVVRRIRWLMRSRGITLDLDGVAVVAY